MDLNEMFAQDATVVPKDTELTEVSVLAERQLFLQSRVAEIEELLENTKADLKLVQEVHLPEAMLAVGMSEFKLANGYKIKIKDDVYATVRKDFIGQAVDWLDNNGLGGIVKDDVSVKFGRGESADALLDYCKQQGYAAEEKLSVHPSTLKATVKEQLAKGVQFPEEFFSVFPVKKAEIKK